MTYPPAIILPITFLKDKTKMFRCLVFSLSLILLSACTSKYIGQSDPLFTEYGCAITEKECSMIFEDLIATYTIESLSNNEYQVIGATQWNNTKRSKIFEKVPRMRMIFAFMVDGVVVQTEDAWARGNEGEPMFFDFTFSTEHDIDSSILIEYRARITE
jgi:hypothetical protein